MTNYISIVAGALTVIIAWFGIKTWLRKKQNNQQQTKLQTDITNTVKQVAVDQVHIDVIEDEKTKIEEQIEAVEKELQAQDVNPQITDAVTVEEAKENIIKKTNRKRKYKKKEVK